MLSRTHPPVRGTVRSWNAEEGWGVVDSPQTAGGCWVHFSAVQVPGWQELEPGTGVELLWVDADQDGYLYRALSVRPDGVDPAYERPVAPQAGTGSEVAAYTSSSAVTFDLPVELPVTGEPEPPRAPRAP